jgi:hypothetical protein
MNVKYYTLDDKPVRQLTVYYKYFDRALSPRGIVVPQIRLMGKWLDGTGFGVGRKFTVELVEGKLILTLVKEAPA